MSAQPDEQVDEQTDAQMKLEFKYDDTIESIQSQLSSRLEHCHKSSALADDFEALIQPTDLVGEGRRLNRAAVRELVTDKKNQSFFSRVPLSPDILIARIWGPFDHRGNPNVERMREDLFKIARDLRTTIERLRSRNWDPWDPPNEQRFFVFLDVIFKPLDLADRCLHSEKARQDMADHIDHIRASCDLANCYVKSAEMQIVKAFAGMDALIAKLDKEKS